jgi:hypothetical protein
MRTVFLSPPQLGEAKVRNLVSFLLLAFSVFWISCSRAFGDELLAIYDNWAIFDEFDELSKTEKHTYYVANLDNPNVFIMKDENKITTYININDKMSSIKTKIWERIGRMWYCSHESSACGSSISVKGLGQFMFYDGDDVTLCSDENIRELSCNLKEHTGLSCIISLPSKIPGLKDDMWSNVENCLRFLDDTIFMSLPADLFSNKALNGDIRIQFYIYFVENDRGSENLLDSEPIFRLKLSSNGLREALDHYDKLLTELRDSKDVMRN